RKGHLPVIKTIGCPIKEDLIRRDFTINAIAKRTTDGEIIDIFNGLGDIKTKTLKILHDNSFIDDPTRIIRGLKFSVRFGFELEKRTEELQKEYLKNVNYDMSYHRLKNEIKSAFSLNRHEIFDKFTEGKMYKLLCEKDFGYNIQSLEIEKLIKKNPSENSWLVYLSFFDLSKLDLTKQEKKILEASNKETDRNTPQESLLIKEIRRNICQKY
ncbi:CCA tRNA nucleotidyltransferase, partial [bacterium]|nr:CCA tRNA nucleotidyltransferase [bacterium]